MDRTASLMADASFVGGSTVGRRMRGDIVVVLGLFLLAGVLAGVLWSQVLPSVVVTRNELGLVTDEVGLARRFDIDAWYAVIGAVGGLVLGAVLTWWRSTHEVVTVLVVTAGALLAALVCARLGTWLGPDDPEQVLAGAEIGATAPMQVRLTSEAAYLAWPVSALVGALVVLWGSGGRRTEAQPRRFRGR